MPEHHEQFLNALRRGSSSYQCRPTCRLPPLWIGMHAATSAVVSQMTRNASAGCGGVYPIVVVALQPVDWRPANSTRCGCAAAAD